MTPKTLRANESGLAAITVTLIILAIVTLITVGFATLMRREQRQALDQQLSTQAFYAAESGVNVAREYIDANDPDSLTEVDRCDQTPAAITSKSSLGNNVSFSCVLLDLSPTQLQSRLSTDSSWVMNIESKTGAEIEKIEISWQSPDSTTFAPANWSDNRLLLPKNTWGETTSIVRTMLMPKTNDRTTLINDTFHAFMYPSASNAATVNWSVPAGTPSASAQGRFLFGNCDSNKAPYYCKVNLTNLSADSHSAYTLRLKAIYNSALVSVRAYDASGNVLELKNGQAKIDATGKAADVVRRIQVNVPLAGNNFPYPEYAVETFSTMCKRFFTWPDNTRVDVDSSNGFNALTSEQREACNPLD